MRTFTNFAKTVDKSYSKEEILNFIENIPEHIDLTDLDIDNDINISEKRNKRSGWKRHLCSIDYKH